VTGFNSRGTVSRVLSRGGQFSRRQKQQCDA
jgi:hypothetical protein